MRKKMVKIIIALVVFVLSGNSLMAQFLDNDTLYIGNASGNPGDQVIIPIEIVSSVDYQGWTMPFNFGYGSSSVYCDSVSFVGTEMEDWWFTAPLVNNNEWDGVQTCGAAGVYSMYALSIPPDHYLAMNIFFTISDTASSQTIPIDTTTAAWYAGGPPQSYIVVVGGNSFKTHVVPGSITIPGGISEDEIENANPLLDIHPTIVHSGASIKITYINSEKSSTRISLFDAVGRRVDTIYQGAIVLGNIDISYSTTGIPSGIYFVVIEESNKSTTKKIIIQ